VGLDRYVPSIKKLLQMFENYLEASGFEIQEKTPQIPYP
jgi:hypothetical protein